MATEKQIIANQQNAKHSTGPRTDSGKRRSRRNAIRHGLTAETIIDALEDPADYKAFERAIKSDYSPQTAIEGQLVTRLVSLLWRLRRAVIIESGLLNLQAGMICDQSTAPRPIIELMDRLNIFRKFLHPNGLESPMSKQTRKILRLAQITQMGQGRIRQIQILRARFYGLHAWTIVSLKDLAATRQTCGVKQHRFCCC